MSITITAKTIKRSPSVKSELKERRSYIIQEIIKNAPKNVPLTDEDIQEEVNMVRYGNKNGKPNRDWNKDLKKIENIKKIVCIK
jgi:hypothetical protein